MDSPTHIESRRARSRSFSASGLFAGLVACVLAGVALAPRPAGPRPRGVSWAPADVDAALARARASGRRVLAVFEAAWCPSCRRLEQEVLGARPGESLGADMIAVRFDFDDERNRPIVERFVVLSLPTALVLAPDGTQVGRVDGYDGRDGWLRVVRGAKGASDPVPALRLAHARAPADARAALALGEALLVRGSPDDGQALLEQVAWMAPQDAPEPAHALFLLGRYHHRVRRDPDTAKHVWKELASRFPASEWASGAWAWYAKAEADLGRPDRGRAALRERASSAPGDLDALADWASFVAKHGPDDDRNLAREAVRGALGGATREQREDLERIVRKLDARR
jgi:hypothetical protein